MAFETNTYSCGGTALAAFVSNPYPMVEQHWRRLTLTPTLVARQRWRHLRLTLDLESARLGMFIGTVYVACPTCADDLLLVSNYPWELQLMLSVSETLVHISSK